MGLWNNQRIPLVWPALSILWILLAGCGGALENRGNKAYNILLVTIDTLRADHLGAYGHAGIETPNLDDLAAEGVRFGRAYTPCPITLPAHVSLMTATYPMYHDVRNNGIATARPSLTTLAEVLKDRGYATGAVLGAFVLDGQFGLDQGFDTYDDEIAHSADVVSTVFYPERRAEEVTQRAFVFLQSLGDQPFFLWLHYFDPHGPYSPPPAYARQYAQSPYDGEIAYVDEQIGVLRKMLRLAGREDTLWVVTSDHGESLMEHGEVTHGILAYDATLHVPLILHHPDLLGRPRVIDAPVSLIDIMPTVLDILNLDGPEDMAGVSLVPLLADGEGEAHDLLYFETLMPYFDFGWAGLRGVRTGEFKYISAPAPELYAYRDDPREVNNLHGSGVESGRNLQGALEALVSRHASPDAGRETGALDPAAREKLSALGYSSGAAHRQLEGDPFSGADPKSMVWVSAALDEATSHFAKGRYRQSIELLESVLEKDPHNPQIPFHLGIAYMNLGRLDKAEWQLNRLLELQPRNLDALTNLGWVYDQQGREAESLEVLEKVLEANPRHVKALYNLSVIHARSGDAGRAEEGFKRLVKISPYHVKVYEALGSLYANQGDFEAALLAFKKAVELDPRNGEAHFSCARCYLELGDRGKALPHLNRARRLGVPLPEGLSLEKKGRGR